MVCHTPAFENVLSELTSHFYEVCGRRVSSAAATGRPHTQLYRRLVDSRSIRAKSGSTSRCCSRSYESVGVKTEPQEKCAFSITENHLSGGGVGFDHDAGTYVPCSDRVDPHDSQEGERRPVTHCQAVSEAAGSDGSCVQRDSYWPAVHETPTVVAQDQGVLPEGKPASHDQGHAALPTCLRHVETTLVLVSGPGVGSSMSPCNASDGRIPHRLGSGHEWPPCPRSVERSSSRLAHQQARDAGHVSGSEILSPRPKRSPCVSSHRQHSGGLLYQPPRRSEVASPVQVGAPDPCVGPGQTPLTQSSLHTGHLNVGADTLSRQGPLPGEWMLHTEVVKQIWRVFGQAQVDLFATQETAQCPLWYSLGLDAMVQTWPRLRLYAFPPVALLPGVLERVRRDGVRLLLVAPFWPGRVWFSDLISLLDGSPWEIPVRRDLLSQAGCTLVHPHPE